MWAIDFPKDCSIGTKDRNLITVFSVVSVFQHRYLHEKGPFIFEKRDVSIIW